MKQKIIALSLFFTLITLGVNAQTNKSFIDRIMVKGYGQFGYSAKFEDNIGNSNSFNINKSEIIVRGKINHKWDMGILFQIHEKPFLKELYTQYHFIPELKIKIGQYKTPFSIENNTAPFLNPLISGGSTTTTYFSGVAGNPHYYGTSGRELGLEISGELFNDLIDYKAVIFNGQGINKLSNINPKMYGGSLNIKPINELSVNCSYLGGHLESMEAGIGTHDLHRVAAGIRIDTKPVLVLSEYMWGKDGDTKGHGAYITTAIHLPKRFDLVIAADYLKKDLNDNKDIITSTIGMTQWFYGSCRWQIEYQYRIPRNNATFLDIRDKGHKFSAQIQFVF